MPKLRREERNGGQNYPDPFGIQHNQRLVLGHGDGQARLLDGIQGREPVGGEQHLDDPVLHLYSERRGVKWVSHLLQQL